MLYMTDTKLDQFSDIFMHQFMEKGIKERLHSTKLW